MKLHDISEGILFEAGLSRLLSHMEGRPFAVVTAFRDDLSLAENRRQNRRLEQRFREFGAGAIKIIGHWQEAPDGGDFDEIDSAQLTDMVEESYFVPLPSHRRVGDLKEWVVSVLGEFNQDAAVFSDGDSVFLIDKSGDLIGAGDGITVDKIAQAYSTAKSIAAGRSKGKTFVFEGSMRPSG